MSVDLHTHTSASDGSDTPAGLVSLAASQGLTALAVTDHDTVDGLGEALAAGERLRAGGGRLEVVPGVELTTDAATCEVHILGLYLLHPHAALQARLAEIKAERVERARRMVYKLQRLGVPLAWETVWETASSQGFIGRSQIFRAMQEQGLIPPERAQDAFAYYFSKDGVAYVPHSYLQPEEAVELIRQAGGVPVLAHPGRCMAGHPPDEGLIRQLVERGLLGLEVYYPSHDAAATAHFQRLAERFRLIPTGGTDYHGHFGTLGAALGSCSPPGDTLPRLVAAATDVRRAVAGGRRRVPG